MDSRCTLDICRTPDRGVGCQGAEDGRCQTQVQPTIFVGRRERRQARQGIARGKSPEPATNGCSYTEVVVLVVVVVAVVVVVVVVVVVGTFGFGVGGLGLVVVCALGLVGWGWSVVVCACKYGIGGLGQFSGGLAFGVGGLGLVGRGWCMRVWSWWVGVGQWWCVLLGLELMGWGWSVGVCA